MSIKIAAPAARLKRARAAKAPAPAHAIRIPKTAEIVAGHIRRMILHGELKEGDFLQPEAHLMAQFGTSRPTIREAFRILESEQFITVSRGSRTGARVQHPSFGSVARLAGFALQTQGATVADVYDARLAIEPHAARLAAERADPECVARLRAELEDLKRLVGAGDGAAFSAGLARIHEGIVSVCGNRTLIMVFAMLVGVIESHQARFKAAAAPARTPAEKRKRSFAGLKSISRLIDLIEAGDGPGAEAHWRRHVENANKSWLAGYDQTAIVDVLR